jgi:hypothetical protein
MKNVEPDTERLAHAHLGQQDPGLARPADVAVAAWCELEAELAPIIGARGYAALFKRSLHLAGSSIPCLRAVGDESPTRGEYVALHAALTAQSDVAAAAIQDALQVAFDELLARLLGASLSQRLLGSARRASVA